MVSTFNGNVERLRNLSLSVILSKLQSLRLNRASNECHDVLKFGWISKCRNVFVV